MQKARLSVSSLVTFPSFRKQQVTQGSGAGGCESGGGDMGTGQPGRNTHSLRDPLIVSGEHRLPAPFYHESLVTCIFFNSLLNDKGSPLFRPEGRDGP